MLDFDLSADTTAFVTADSSYFEFRSTSLTPPLIALRKKADRLSNVPAAKTAKWQTPLREQFFSFGEVDSTEPLEDWSVIVDEDDNSSQDFDHSAEVLKTSKDRVELLQRYLESKDRSKEDAGRLGILTQRLRRLSPRTTLDQIEHQEKVVAQLELSGEELSKLQNLIDSL